MKSGPGFLHQNVKFLCFWNDIQYGFTSSAMGRAADDRLYVHTNESTWTEIKRNRVPDVMRFLVKEFHGQLGNIRCFGWSDGSELLISGDLELRKANGHAEYFHWKISEVRCRISDAWSVRMDRFVMIVFSEKESIFHLCLKNCRPLSEGWSIKTSWRISELVMSGDGVSLSEFRWYDDNSRSSYSSIALIILWTHYSS
jgi:hypothetical protein